MKDVFYAFGVFLVSLLIAVGVEKVLVMVYGMDLPAAGAMATATLIGVGFWIIQATTRKRS